MNRSITHRALLLGTTAFLISGIAACASAQAAGDAASAAAAPAADAAAADADAMANDAAAQAEADATAEVAGMAPDHDKYAKHAEEHITYPADKAAILAQCAETDEFTDAEKAWVAGKLPEGEYASADELLTALEMKAPAEDG